MKLQKRNILYVSLFGAALWGIASIPLPAQNNNGESEVQRGFDISPVELNLKDKNRSLVGLGSYYVNGASDCTGCHNRPITSTPPGAHVAGGRAFGPVIARNLTPDSAGRPAGLTLSEFKLEMRTGIDLKDLPPTSPAPDPHLLQVMPWQAFGQGTDRFQEAIYEYLSAMPCVPGIAGVPATGTTTRCN